MDGTPALYLGRLVPKKGFRTFIHSVDGAQKLVESWAEYESNMQSGLWFAEKYAKPEVIPVLEDIKEISFTRIEKPKKPKGK